MANTKESSDAIRNAIIAIAPCLEAYPESVGRLVDSINRTDEQIFDRGYRYGFTSAALLAGGLYGAYKLIIFVKKRKK